MLRKQTYQEVLTAAIEDMVEHGFDSAERVAMWMARLREAAVASMRPSHEMEEMLRQALGAVYRRLVERGQVVSMHPGIGRFTLERVRPQLRAELDRRLMAAASLIRLNKEEAVGKTLRRFEGWATSIPKGGTEAAKRAQVKAEIKKPLASLPFVERRVLIDQGHKLTASISEVLATDGGAIAATWRSNWRQANYDYREDHKERDGLVYLLPRSWALERGLVKPGPAGWYSDVTSAGEEPFCRCYIRWVHALGAMPAEMLTKRGREALEAARETTRAA